MQSQRRGAILILGVLLASAVVGGVYGPSVRATAAGVNDLQDSVKSFTRVLAIVQSNYADPVDVDRAVYQGAVPGMLRVLDPHSTFFDQRTFAIMREDQRGRYYGVGMQVGPQNGRTVVTAPFVNSPAYKVGIRPGDIIVKVDDKSVDGLSTTEVADMLKGPKGTVVRITVSREGYSEPLTFTVVRDEIPRHTVDIAFLLRPAIGYVKLSGFNEVTDKEMGDALRDLGVSQLSGLVLDLRGNPGGLLNESVQVADMFLQKNQLIVTQRGRSSPERRYYAVKGNQGVDVPLVVLVNSGTASAAEIVSGAIQDHDRGLVVGDVSFGKGLVQGVSQLSENTGLALTIARYYTPSGRLIQRDYKSTSLYDYHYNRKTPKPTEIKLTDSGRQVTGGGGITPDVAIAEPKYDRFQEVLLQRDVFWPFDAGVGGFTLAFLGTKPEITHSFTADDRVLNEFRNYLEKSKIRFTESDIQDNLAWIKRRIKREVFTSVFGIPEGYKVELEEDPQLLKAIESIPQARALYENARKIVAQRNGAGGTVR